MLKDLPLELQELIWEGYTCGLRLRAGRSVVLSQDALWEEFQVWASARGYPVSKFALVGHLHRMDGVEKIDGGGPLWVITAERMQRGSNPSVVERFMRWLLAREIFTDSYISTATQNPAVP
jgi:hypothetical protein